MNTSFQIAKKVELLFLNNKFLKASEIAEKLDISRTITHKALKDLLKDKKIKKI
jgi:predicted transcriptional regulator